MSEAKKKARTLSISQILSISERLKVVMEPVPDRPGFVRYKDRNMTDDTIAKEFEVSVFQVRRVRMETLGQVKSAEKKDQSPELEEVEQMVAQLCQKHNALLLQLKHNCKLPLDYDQLEVRMSADFVERVKLENDNGRR